jgi:hypothetical protein
MWRPDAIATEDRAAALRAIIQYLVGSTKLTLAKIAKNYPKEAEDEIRNFMRLNAVKYRGDRRLLSELSQAVNAVLAEEDVEIPNYFLPAARVAGILIDRGRPEGIPSFVDYQELPGTAGTVEQNRELIRAYEGCWRVYRVSSTSAKNDVRLNRGFLNIKPYTVLTAEDLGVPEFSLYQRIEPKAGLATMARKSSNLTKLYGVLLQTNDYITLVGEREKIGLGLGYIGMLTWLTPRDIDGRLDEFHGLCLTPNAEGSYISAFFIARFLHKSNQLDHDKFEKLKQQELRLVGSSKQLDVEETEVLSALREYSKVRQEFFEL